MLYVLTPGLKDDIKALENHPGMIHSHVLEELFLFNKGFSTSTEDVILDAVRHLNRTMDIQGHNRFWFIARSWFGKGTPDLIYPYDGSRNTDRGQWIYQYGYIYDTTLTISKKFMSAVHEYTSNGILVHYNGKTFPVLDIVNSTDAKYFKMIIPGDNNMFSGTELKYKLPVSLLT